MVGTLNLTGVMDELLDSASDNKPSIKDMVEAFENRGYGPLLLVPSLLAILPTGAIPGIPSACGITIFLITIQLVIGKDHPWLPAKLKNIEFERETLKKGVEKVKPYTQKIDKIFKPRLEFFIHPVAKRFIALICGLTALLFIPLELLPFAAALPASAVGFMGIGLSTKDGVMTSIGLTLALVSLWLVLTQLPMPGN
ncbi:exopolysaccharide biosynthesis protein [Alteromonas ponticola]|uniref:Exopolysaccharide biosynthesis protein n=1 Tax=Alteromonas ponticola TaxID=2720613 RepID=A0ABX1R0T9_9ALTE|nr:exopolysaccharide biosynthesis protein [Alteromonas ponticola]NMH60080.1 exopolysaccharide biosynthesis protein [Alteromonas ponticola]